MHSDTNPLAVQAGLYSSSLNPCPPTGYICMHLVCHVEQKSHGNCLWPPFSLLTRAFAELRSYTDPPSVVQQTVQALILTLYPQASNWEQWTTCKQVLHKIFFLATCMVHRWWRYDCVCFCVVCYADHAQCIGEVLSQFTGATSLPWEDLGQITW